MSDDNPTDQPAPVPDIVKTIIELGVIVPAMQTEIAELKRLATIATEERHTISLNIERRASDRWKKFIAFALEKVAIPIAAAGLAVAAAKLGWLS